MPPFLNYFKRTKAVVISTLLFQVNLTIDPEEEQYILSECWGSFFYHEEEDPKHDKHMNTYWGRVINHYNVIAVPTIEYIAGRYQLLWLLLHIAYNRQVTIVNSC